MYAIIDGLEFVASIGGAIYAIISNKWYVGIACTIFFFIYPIINELFYNALSKIFWT
jgi:hypothetical protein